jgi:hypothetical protein
MPTKSVIERTNDRGSYGFCRIEILGVTIRAHCEWPLDLDLNDIFNFTMTFPRSTWEQALGALSKVGKAEILDSSQNHLSLTSLGQDKEDVAIEMIKGHGPLARSLYLGRSFSLSDLISLK